MSLIKLKTLLQTVPENEDVIIMKWHDENGYIELYKGPAWKVPINYADSRIEGIHTYSGPRRIVYLVIKIM